MTTFWRSVVVILALTLMAPVAFGAQQAYKLRVDGLACPFCAYGVEKQLNSIKGVQRIDVDIASGTVSVTMAEGASLDEAAAQKAVKAAGFSLRGFEAVPPGARTN